jgi:WXG100 family type VII secretion target
MAEIKATLSEMRKASQRIQSASDEFIKVAGQVLRSAEALGTSWQGDSQVAFITEQRQANEWYQKMTELVNQCVLALKNAADEYEETDESAARLIKNN